MKNYLEDKYPQLIGNVSGGNFPPPPHLELLAKVVGSLQLFGFIFMFMGGSIFNMLGMEPPAWMGVLSENKMSAVAFLFIANNIAQGMIATGAFEVTLNGQIIHSKLATGRMPSLPELHRGLSEAGLESY